MVKDLQELMRHNVAAPPPDHLDLEALVGAGRRRVRRRRTTVAGIATVAATGAVAGTLAVTGLGQPRVLTDGDYAAMPRPDAPTIRLADAGRAVEGEDYRVLASHTNADLDADNGQYLDGVTEDGKVLFRDGPRMDQLHPRFALMDPTTSEKDWLPRVDVGQARTWPVELGADRLVLVSLDDRAGHLRAHVFDRSTSEWSTTEWSALPSMDVPRVVAGPEGRLYVLVPATTGKPPEGGWPTGPDGEADDSDADGDTFRLWSASPTDPTDVRDEGLRVGEVAFTDEAMVWTDSSNGDAGMVHVRDLRTGEERSFDPRAGEKCNLLELGASGEHVVMSQYCGTYRDGVRDDRVQVLTTDGEQVVTLQDSGIEGWLPAGGDVVNVSAHRGDDRSGTYVYDLATDRFLRVSDGLSSWGAGGSTAEAGQFFWHTPVNRRNGATQWIGELTR